MEDLLKYTDDVLKAAIYQCDSLEEAQDIAQETLLAGISAISKGQTIANPKAWLFSTMKNKYYDLLRKKYHYPTISFDLIEDMEDENEGYEELEKQEEAVQIRKQLAYLAKIYREVMTAYYMYGKSVNEIAKSLNIPANTVKSRLDAGRKHIRKEFGMREEYVKQSYEPDKLWISISGREGFDKEPFSLVQDEIAMNLLILAYDKPVTIQELSKMIGIPTAYVETIVKKLADGALMKSVGNKVYTDFIIFRKSDWLKNYDFISELVKSEFERMWEPLEKGLEKLRHSDFYLKLGKSQQIKLESYFVIKILSRAEVEVRELYSSSDADFQYYPERPNGGKWFCMGYYYPNGEEEWDAKYSVSGEVKAEIQEFAGLKEVFLVEYDTSLGRTHQGYNSTKYVKHPMDSKELLDVLISVDIKNPEIVLRKKYLLENIEGLCELGYLVRENSELRVDIPVINTESYELLKSIMDSSKRELLEVLTPLGKLMCEKGYVKVPEHIKSVPKFYKYYPCMVSLPMTIVYEAVEKGMFLKGVNENVPAALIVIDK